MNEVELRHLRTLVAVADEGGFTPAAAVLGLSQPAVSRALASLEEALGTRLLRRTNRETVLTPEGAAVLARARRVLGEVDDLVREARTGRSRLRVGHAWAALGRHTVPFQRRFAERRPDVSLSLVRTNSATGGLAEGACDIAVVRTAPTSSRVTGAVVGLERRYCVLASDDPWARRRSIPLGDVAQRVVAVDRRTGTTTAELWPAGARPQVEHVNDVDDWLAVIATGRRVGVTAESTVSQYRRTGVVFRPLRDAPPVTVRVIWWREDPHPLTADVVALLAELYR